MNIILCMCDQLRAFEVGCYGGRDIATPFALDQRLRHWHQATPWRSGGG